MFLKRGGVEERIPLGEDVTRFCDVAMVRYVRTSLKRRVISLRRSSWIAPESGPN